MKTQAYSVVLPGYEYVPDSEPHVFEGRLYLYGSHDKFSGKRFCENNYVLWSAAVNDLASWRFEGEIYSRTQDPTNPGGKLAMWAPDATQGADGRFYLYYCLADYPQISVAVCDTPAGKFEYYGFVRDGAGNALGQREGDTLPFDPAVLADDDGRIWLYFGNGPMDAMPDKNKRKASKCAELQPDMLTMKAQPKRLIPTQHDSKGSGFEGHEFFEASSIRKFGGRYYFVYSSVNCHELCYAVSKKPDGGFVYGGTLVSNGDIRPEDGIKMGFNGKPDRRVCNYIGNNHGSLIEINGKYYVFYHRPTNRTMFSRQACAEAIRMLPDGRFQQAELTSCGLNGGALAGKGRYEARIACHLWAKKGALFSVHPLVQNKKHPALTQDGADRESDANQHIENMRDGATAGFRYFDFKDVGKISATTRGNGKGRLVVKNSAEGEVVAVIEIKPSRVWQCFEAPLHVDNGVGSLYFTYEGAGAMDFLEFMIL